MNQAGKLIVIEGLDGSGKATQAGLLAAALSSRGCPVRQVSFPDYRSDSSALVRMYLSGAFGSAPDDVNAYAASSFYAVDRYASYKQDWGTFYHGGGTVIADRYTTSNGVHQCSKLDRTEWDGFLRWLSDYEYGLLGIPAPDAVIYLRLPLAVSQQLLDARYQRDGGARDIHERDLAYLSRSAAAAEYCCARLGWHAIDCVQNGTLRPPEEIHAALLALLETLHLVR
ncbi:MAG: thymidylate kinase [Oscillospiraceae bacterium]|nr:thymidylate kinase [Oscillospiraceae bacterium]